MTQSTVRAQEPLFEPEQPPKRTLGFIGRWYAITRPEPPKREQMFADGDSRQWLEWHWARGLDPYAPRRRGRRLASALRRAVIERDGYVCGLCGDDVEPDRLHIDHIKPVLYGGRDELTNLQVAHAFCNLSKGARL